MKSALWFAIGALFGSVLSASAMVLALAGSLHMEEKAATKARKVPAVMDQQFHDEAARAVRPIVDADGDVACSAVVIAPGIAMSAAHCYGVIVTVDGLKATRAELVPGTDVMRLTVPGIACPCATPAQADAAVGETVYAVGFPFYGQPQPSPQVITGPGTVTRIGNINGRYPQCPIEAPVCRMIFIEVAPAMLDGGQSGGGAFVFRDGHWVLIAVNSVGYGPNGRADETHSGLTPISALK